MNSLDEWLGYVEKVHSKTWDLGLARVNRVAEELGVTLQSSRVAIVAGTNGKGSTCEYMEQFCIEAGLSVGKSTSPHLLRFNERIQVNGSPVSDELIAEAFESIETARRNISLTYFEFAVLASALILNRSDLDIWILEVGLGGRLDAMNIFSRDISVITQIALDHQAWLGNSREEIAIEKAAIMRPGIPCVVADPDPPATLMQYARKLGITPYLIGKDFGFEDGKINIQGRAISDLPVPQLPKSSAVAALQAVSCLGVELNDLQILEVIRRTRLTGRLQWFDTKPKVLCDVAHNPAAAVYLRDYLKTYFNSVETKPRVHAVVGMYSDKELSKVINTLSPLVHRWYFTDMDDARAATAKDLQWVLGDRSNAETCGNISTAFEKAKRDLNINDLIVVFGSFPVVAGVLSIMSTSLNEE